MPLLNQRTLELFGYTLDTVTPGMAKKVAVACNDCGIEFVVIRKNLNEHGVCRKCSFKRIPRENYARGVAKREATCEIKFGQKTPPRTEEWEENRKNALRTKYGGAAPLCDPKILAKAKATNLARYKTEWAVTAPEVRAKAEQTMLEHHGVRFSRQSSILQAKAVKTLQQNYGVANPGEHPALKAKAMQTMLERFGTLNGVPTGAAENEVADFVRSLNLEVTPHYIIPNSNLEIDCFIATHQIGIEYCGLYYHCEPPYNEDPRVHARHRRKLDTANKVGIRLITLFEDEWLFKRSHVEGSLRIILRKPHRTIHGRNCNIEPITQEESTHFLLENHVLGGHPHTKQAWRLYTSDNITVGVLALAHNYGANKKHTIVMQRLCFLQGVHVQGGASKLLETAKTWARTEGYSSLVTFSDNRWSTGNAYQKLGFTCIHENKYDYGYVDFSLPPSKRIRLSKQTQQKKRTKCPEDMTERSWATHRGLWRIWDCGHKHWEFVL